MFETRKPTKELKRILNSRKLKVYVNVKSSHKLQPSYWDGGSRTLTYRLVGTSLHPIETVSNPFNDSPNSNKEVVLEPGMILVELGHFCGKEAIPMLIVSDVNDLKGLVNGY